MSDWISQLKTQQAQQAKEDDFDLWGNLGAGGYSALDEVLMGLPSFLVKNVGGKETWNKLDQFRKEHKLASDIGGGAGFIGSMLIPAGGIAKLAGKGAKALKLAKLASKLDKAGDIAKLSTKGLKGLEALKVGAKAGAMQALEQGIPRALTGLEGVNPFYNTGYTKEDLAKSAGQGLQNIGTGALFGGATGATLGRLFDKLGVRAKAGIEDIGEGANALYLKQLGAIPRDIAEKFGGKGKGLKGSYAVQNIDDYMADLTKFGKKNKLHIDPYAEDFAKKQTEKWNALSKNYDKAGVLHNVEDIAKSPSVSEVMENFVGEEEAAGKMLSSITSALNKKKSAGAQKAFLDDLVKRGYQSVNPADSMRGELAAAVKEKIDDMVLDLSGVPEDVLQGMKKEYALSKPLLNAVAKKKMTLPQLGGGSPTQEKQLIEKLAMPLVGAIGGQATQGGDLTDPETWAKKAQAGITGAIMGTALNKGAAGLRNLTGEKLGRLFGSKPVAGLVGEAVQNLPGKLSGALPSKLGQKDESIQAGAEGGGGSPEETKQAIAQTEAGTDPATKEETKQEFTEQYKNTIKNQLAATFEAYYKNNPDFPGLTLEKFAQMVQKKTDNFDPVKSSKLLFPDNPEMEAAYLQKYETMLYLKNLDAENALSKNEGILGFGGGYNDEANYQKVRDLMINIASGGKIENMDSASMLKMVDQDLARIMKAKGYKKAALMDMLTRKYGLDFADLQGMGVL